MKDLKHTYQPKKGFQNGLSDLLSGKVLEKFGVWVEKSMYGRKYMGIQRSTFLINEKSKIEYIWEKVKVKMSPTSDIIKVSCLIVAYKGYILFTFD